MPPKKYAWLPYPDVGSGMWEGGTYHLASERGYRILPRRTANGVVGEWPEVLADHHSNWADVDGGDTIGIIAHGLSLSSRKVGWHGGKGRAMVKWTVERLVNEIDALGPNIRQLDLTYELIVCWGANGWLGGKFGSFGSNLATYMGTRGYTGRVLAYRGSVLIGATTALVVNGRTRLGSIGKSATHTAANTGLLTGVMPARHHSADTQAVTWPIPG